MLPGPGNILIAILVVTMGWTIFAYFADIGCDPLKAGYISNTNQVTCVSNYYRIVVYAIYTTKKSIRLFLLELLPYFVATVLDVPGLPGLFLACVAACALR